MQGDKQAQAAFGSKCWKDDKIQPSTHWWFELADLDGATNVRRNT